MLCPRDELATHLAACPFEACSALFEANDARLQQLEESNAAMALKIGSLTAKFEVFQAELANMTASLGLAGEVFELSATRRPSLPHSRPVLDPVLPIGGSDLGDSADLAVPGNSPTPSMPRRVTASVASAAGAASGPDSSSVLSTRVEDRSNGSEGLRSLPRPMHTLNQRSPLDRSQRRRSSALAVVDMLPRGMSTEQSLAALRSIVIHLGMCLDNVDNHAHL